MLGEFSRYGSGIEEDGDAGRFVGVRDLHFVAGALEELVAMEALNVAPRRLRGWRVAMVIVVSNPVCGALPWPDVCAICPQALTWV